MTADTKTEKQEKSGPDYSATLFLPQTDFPMRAGLPQKEPEILARWNRLDIYRRQREQARGREKYVLHDGPPYANGNLHIGHALNKILKDTVARSMQMLGYDSNYVPGWDCHGLPIEWKIEEQYRARGKNKDDVPVNEFRKECRDFAQHWLGVQREEFKRLGVEGDWDNPYTTMSFAAEAQIARELMKFSAAGQLYRGSKPVMWSVVEKTSLAEAEIEYQDYQSDTIWVKFPVLYSSTPVRGKPTFDESGAPILDHTSEQMAAALSDVNIEDCSIVIWTTTPWTLPGNRAISFSQKIAYGVYEVTKAAADNWAKVGDKLILADKLADDVMKQARVTAYVRRASIAADRLSGITACAHPLRDLGYSFDVPLLAGDHVTDDAGTGFVHTAPGHGADDFEIWMDNKAALERRGIDTAIPYTVDADGFYTNDAPGFAGKRVITDKGDKGDANGAVIEALTAAGALIARGRLKHQYPHSWRSKKPIIFRNTPQWFIAMDKDFGDGSTLRSRALKAIAETRFVPAAGQNRLRGMIEAKPDWVVSRQRAWGVPITVFFHKQTGELLNDTAVNGRIAAAFEAEGADAWFADGAKERFLGNDYKADEWQKVDDILDVWFDSGSTHAFVLEQRSDLKWPADLYLEGSDQHRGWFHSSLLESCGTRGRAPYDAVLTHGFTMAEDGRKMSKSLGNQVFPQKVVDQYGADILRLWVMSTDYADDQRIGPDILKSNADAYRRLRNTIRFMLGNLAGFSESERLDVADMPELERWVLHRLYELNAQVRQGYRDFTYQRLFSALFNFATVDLSAIYFDIRKDALYCDAATSLRRRACRTVLDHLFRCLVTWLAPMLAFTMEEAWTTRFTGEEESVHLQLFAQVPERWRDDALAEKFRKLRALRRVVTGALEIERAEKRIGSSLEAAPVLFVSDPDLLASLEGIDMAELCITSALTLRPLHEAPADAFRLAEATDKAAVAVGRAQGEKCARCWMILPDVGSVAGHAALCRRCGETIEGGR